MEIEAERGTMTPVKECEELCYPAEPKGALEGGTRRECKRPEQV